MPTTSVFSPNLAKITPTNKANTMICNILPLANEPIGLSGIIFKIVSTNDVDSTLSTLVTFAWIVDISNPVPGLIKFPTNKATVIASAVVRR